MPYGSTFTANLTRDQLIDLACKDAGILEDGETLPGGIKADAILTLNGIMRELDAAGKWLWAEKIASVTLVANQWVYTSADGFPTDLREPDRIVYRTAQADDWPVEIITSEGYAAITNKLQQGDPSKVYLASNRAIGSQTLYVWPALASVNTQSVVTGTDTNPYKCIRSHTADSTNKPITGANYLLYWESGGTSPSVWAADTDYTAPQLLRLHYRRPLYEFGAATDNPDMPTQWTRLLRFRLASDLAVPHGTPIEVQQILNCKARGAYDDIFSSLRPQHTDFHNFTKYF